MRNGRNVSILHNLGRFLPLLAGAVAAAAFAFPQGARAAAINVALANASTTTTTGNPTNSGINPLVGQVPKSVTIPVAPGQTYDAADIADTGTLWNSIESVSTPPTSPSSTTPGQQVIYQTGIPLLDSSGAATGVTLNVSAIEGAAKSNYIHTGHNDTGTAGTGANGSLPSNPASTPDGFGTGNAHNELMNTTWVANGTADGMAFTFNGLTPLGTYDLYVYGAGSVNGEGATFALDASNGGASATTNSDTGNVYRSVFGPDGIDPSPEKSLSWNLLSGTADSVGALTFTALASESVGPVKPAVNGFQLQAVASPEPASLGVLALGGVALLARRCKV